METSRKEPLPVHDDIESIRIYSQRHNRPLSDYKDNISISLRGHKRLYQPKKITFSPSRFNHGIECRIRRICND